MRLFSFYPQASDVGETHSLMPATVHQYFKEMFVHRPSSSRKKEIVINIHHVRSSNRVFMEYKTELVALLSHYHGWLMVR
jgi:hypothetical protein